MFSSSSTISLSDKDSRSQRPRNSIDQPNRASIYSQPVISHQPPTPSASIFVEGHQAAAPGAFAAQPFSIPSPLHHQQQPQKQQQPPDLLHAPVHRSRSASLRTSSSSESGDLRRSHSLNEGNMSNSQAYYQMATPLGYGQAQIYGQGPLSPTSYYQSLPAQVPLPSAGYMDQQPRQGMPSIAYYDSPMQYSQSSYPASYATSYTSNGVLSTQSYGSPVQSQQYNRAAQPSALAGAPVQVVDRAKKPQCWEHGCNGREFSTFSNLLRHQREKSGTAAKSYCPHCGAEFTRTTARNGHMEHGKCKTRRAATGSQASS